MTYVHVENVQFLDFCWIPRCPDFQPAADDAASQKSKLRARRKGGRKSVGKNTTKVLSMKMQSVQHIDEARAILDKFVQAQKNPNTNKIQLKIIDISVYFKGSLSLSEKEFSTVDTRFTSPSINSISSNLISNNSKSYFYSPTCLISFSIFYCTISPLNIIHI